MNDFVWIFNGSHARFPSAVFTSIASAKQWIAQHSLSGVLTKFPLNMGVYDWAVNEGYFVAKKEKHSESNFIGRFTTAHQEHFHFCDGIIEE